MGICHHHPSLPESLPHHLRHSINLSSATVVTRAHVPLQSPHLYPYPHLLPPAQHSLSQQRLNTEPPKCIWGKPGQPGVAWTSLSASCSHVGM